MSRYRISGCDTGLSKEWESRGRCPICGYLGSYWLITHGDFLACGGHRMRWQVERDPAYLQFELSLEDVLTSWEEIKDYVEVRGFVPPRICIRKLPRGCGDPLFCALCGENFKDPSLPESPLDVNRNDWGAFVEGVKDPSQGHVCPECVRRFDPELQPILEMKVTRDETSSHDGDTQD